MKKKKADLQISLFPFLSILACVIGILTLMITAIVIAQIDPESVNDKIETALEDDEEFQKKVETKKKELQKLRIEINEIKSNPKKKIDPNRKDLLKQELANLSRESQKREAEQKKSQSIRGEVVKVRSELATLIKDLDQAEEEWELMKDPDKFATMVVKQGGSGVGGDLEPTFIECHAKGIRIYDQKGKYFEVITNQIPSHPKFKGVIQQLVKDAPYRTWRSSQGTKIEARFIKREGSEITLNDKKGKVIKLPALQLDSSSRKIIYKYEEARKAKRPAPEARYVIFLLRATGIASWYKATLVCQSLGCKFGQLPLDGEGEIDLSLFLGS
ncbi:MAG: hypothetical protein HN548_03905 [Opitutae bacterium]|nr:hypothetical protein [Opitutae bacterium]